MRTTLPAVVAVASLLVLLPSAASALAVSLFVSPTGSDAAGDGSRAAPFASVARAQAAVRAATANATLPLTQDAVVSLDAGLYIWPEPLRFGAADSGSGGFAVRYEGAAGSVVYIGVRFANWTRSSPDSPIWVASVSGLAPPASPAPWRFYTLTEGDRAATIARLPNKGSGYLSSLGIANSDSGLSWPAGNPYMPPSFSVENAQVFCNLGADWFTETRGVTGADFASRTLTFGAGGGGVAGCNDKAYLQGPKEFIDEAGEWALEPAAGLLFYWPYDEASLLPGAAQPVVAATAAAAIDFLGDSRAAPVHDVALRGIEVRGSGFTPDGTFSVFSPGRPNDTPAPTNSGMVRVENAANISLSGVKLLHAGLSALFISGAATNVSLTGSWVEGSGFCGVATNGPYPADGPYTSAEDAYANHGHTIADSLIYDVGKRVGHAAGVWLFQSGDTVIRNNYIKETPRNGVGMYGVRFGAGRGGGVLPGVAFNKTLDFFSSLELLTTRRNVVAFNRVENAVRDTCDSGAFETWGIGVNNTWHTNALSDMDSGGADGSWMNFMFSDDASHWQNMSSNVLFNVRGKGNEEATMQKSVYDTFENNVVAFSVLGHASNLEPYIEPAGMMTIRRNVFAFLSSPDGSPGPLTVDVNGYSDSDVLHSCSLLPGHNDAYNFSNSTVPRSSDPVIAYLDDNLYFAAQHNVSDLQPANAAWDAHSISADPLFVGNNTPAWARSYLDLELAPSSPAFALPGFRRIELEKIGLGAAFGFDLSTWARRGRRGEKIQAESYDRQLGLWREGSYAISPGPKSWSFDAGAWAMYLRAEAATGATVLGLRITPLEANRTVALAVGSPAGVVAVFDAAAAGAPPGVMALYNVTLAAPLLVPQGAALFLLPDGPCVIDFFSLS